MTRQPTAQEEDTLTTKLPCERWTRYPLNQPDTVYTEQTDLDHKLDSDLDQKNLSRVNTQSGSWSG